MFLLRPAFILLPLLLGCQSQSGSGARDNRGQTASNGPSRRYDIERGFVEYTLDGMEIGTETVHFKAFGNREVKRKKYRMDLGVDLGVASGPAELVSLIEGTTIVNYDPVTKTGTRTLHSLELLGGEERFRGKNMVEVSKSMYAAMGGKVIGKKTIAGHECELWKIEQLSTETCLHHGLALEVRTDLSGMKQHAIAVKVDWDAQVDDALFVVPKDIALREIDLKKQEVLQTNTGGSGPTSPASEALRRMRESAPTK
jgi:hypothetical protein